VTRNGTPRKYWKNANTLRGMEIKAKKRPDKLEKCNWVDMGGGKGKN
jgi:hypothetical protein